MEDENDENSEIVGENGEIIDENADLSPKIESNEKKKEEKVQKKELRGLFCILQVIGYSFYYQLFNGPLRIACCKHKPPKKRKKKDEHPTFRRISDSVEIRNKSNNLLINKDPWKSLFSKCTKLFIHCSTKKCYSILFGEFKSKEIMGKKMDKTRRKNNRKKMTITSIEVAASNMDIKYVLERDDQRIEDLSCLLKLSSVDSKSAFLLRKLILTKYNLIIDPKIPQSYNKEEEESLSSENEENESFEDIF